MDFFPLDTDKQFEFDKIKSHIVQHCRCTPSRELAASIKPVKHVEQLMLLLAQCDEYKRIIEHKMFFPDATFTDLSKEVGLLFIQGSVIGQEQFSNIRSVSDTVNTIIAFLTEKQKLFPALFKLIDELYITTEIIDAINHIIDIHGEVKSSASKELAEIRRDLSAKRREADRRFRSFVNDLRKLGWLRDNEENFYNGRRVLSVLAEHKRDVKGLVHGSSDTGKTTFIEPYNTIEINNEIADLEQSEKREVYRLLKQLTDDIRPHRTLIKNYQLALTHIDFTRAKALFATEINAHLPQIEKQPVIKLVNARHPLLLLQNKHNKKNTVPLNLHLDALHRIVIISGPNAGGKSITLKTVGLLQMMLQSGLLISAAEGSVMSLFQQVHSDIGDSQSIEYELSTYSSRLVKMKYFVEHANRRTLVLIDEFGTGSDPELGGAIAEVILEELARKKAFGIVTTHYTNIKLLAENLHGVTNACMVFDAETLQPKYELLVGQPGSSYTFEVARKIGLPEDILTRAGKKIQREKLKLNHMLLTLQKEKQKLSNSIDELKKQEEKANESSRKYDALAEKIRLKLERDKEKAEENIRLAELGRRLHALTQDWEKATQKKEVIQKFVGLMTAEKKKKMEKIAEEKRSRKKEKTIARKIEQIKVGSNVRLLNSKQTGIVEEIAKNKAKVTFGGIKSIVSIENLELA
ncbi:MAG: endonuclease MutS2 [Bacteroidota bacterium]